MRCFVAAAMVMLLTSGAGATPAPWEESEPFDGAALHIGTVEWVRHRGAWYRSESGTILRSTDGATWKKVAGAPTALRLHPTPVALFATTGGKIWRSEDGVAWNQLPDLDGARVNRIRGDAKLLVTTGGKLDDYRCSNDGGLTWTRPGKGFPGGDPSIYGVAVHDGRFWLGLRRSLDDVAIVHTKDGCKTFKTLATGRWVQGVADGVVVEKTDAATEVSFDDRKTWRKSPVSADDTSHVLLWTVTPKGYFHAGEKGAWLVAADGNHAVPLDGVDLDLENALGAVAGEHLYLFADAGGKPRFYRASLADLAALPVEK